MRVFMDVPCDSKGDEVDRLQTDESKCAELEQVVREMKEEMSILQQHLNRFHKQALSQLSQMDLELQGIALVPSDEVCKKDEDICKLQERLRQFHEEALSQLEGDRVSFW